MDAQGLSRRERQIMDVIYARNKATANEILGAIPDPPSYSAVRAALRVLEEKGHVKHEQDGPRYVYVPMVPRDKARRAAMKHLVRTFFNGSAAEAAAALLRMTDKLSENDIERLLQDVTKARKEGR